MLRPKQTGPSRGHSGFTLLEVILALAIGLMLLAGLYLALNLQVSHTNSGRELVDRSKVVRIVLQKLSEDIGGQLAIPTKSTASSTAATTPTDAATSTEGTSNTGNSGTATGNSTTGSTTSGSSSATTEEATTQTDSSTNQVEVGSIGNVGVLGSMDRLILVISRVPKAPTLPTAGNLMQNEDSAQIQSDLSRITYWLVDNSDQERGLARHETSRVTATNEPIPPDIAEPKKYIIADQVTAVSFQYHDGSSWTDSWDGTAMQEDGKTPVGPPVAIAIFVTLRTGPNRSETPGEITYRHVVAIPTANRMGQTQTTTTGQ